MLSFIGFVVTLAVGVLFGAYKSETIKNWVTQLAQKMNIG